MQQGGESSRRANMSSEPISNGTKNGETATRKGRRANGQFDVGNPGGPGRPANPHGRHVACLRSALVGAVTAEDMTQLGRKLVELAVAGDLGAAELLLAHTVGKPAKSVNPDR